MAANIVTAANGQTPSKAYKGSTEMIIVTNGKVCIMVTVQTLLSTLLTANFLLQGGGVAYVDILWGLMFGNWFSRFAKSKDLLIGLSKNVMGY